MAEPATAAQLLQQGLFHHRQGDLAQAMERYVEVLRIDPQNPDALYYVAVVACQEGQFQQGIELARRAITIGPPQARVHNLLGQALYRQGDRLEAIKSFDRAIAIDANFADAHGNRANILLDAGFADEALKSFDRALALNPASAPDWLNRGVAAAGARPPRRGVGELRQGGSVWRRRRRKPMSTAATRSRISPISTPPPGLTPRRASTQRWRPTRPRSSAIPS